MTETVRAEDIKVGFNFPWQDLTKLDKKLNDLTQKFNKIGSAKTGDPFSKANSSGKRVNKTISQTRAEYRKATQEAAKFGQAQKRAASIADGLKKVSAQAEKVAKASRGMSLAIGAGTVYSVKKAMDLQDSLKRTSNLLVTGGEKQAEVQRNVNQMRKDGANLSVKYGKSQAAIADGYQELVKRGYTSNQALGAQKSLLQASVASGDDYADVVHGATTALESFGMRAKTTNGMIANTKKVVNEMAYASDLTATDFQSMSKAMEYVGTSAHQSGFSLHETASAIGVLSNSGIEADKAGTGLRKMITSLQAPGKTAADQLGDLGLKTKDFVGQDGKMKSMVDIFKLLREHTKGMGEAEQGTVFHNLFGATGQQAGAILAENTRQLEKLDKAVAKSPKKNYVQTLADKNMKSTLSQWKQFKESLNAVAITAGSVVLPEANKLMKSIAHLMDNVNQMPKSAKSFAVWGTMAVGAIYPVAKIVSTTTKAMASLKSAQAWMLGKMASNASMPYSNTNAQIPATRTEKYSNAARSSFTNGLSYAAVGANFGIQAAQAFKDGIDTKKGGAEMWNATGQGIGGAIGTYLGGPVGGAIGTAIGGATATAINERVHLSAQLDKNMGSSNSNKGRKRQKDINRFTGEGRVSQTTTNSWAAGSGMSTKAPKVKKRKPTSPYKGIAKSAQKEANNAIKAFQTANGRIVANGGKTSKKIGQKNATTYKELEKSLSSYTKKSQKSNKTELSYLTKNAGLSKKTAEKIARTSGKADNKRVKSAKKAINSIIKTEESGGRVSQEQITKAQNAISKVIQHSGDKNKNVVKKNADKEKIILGKLRDATKKITAKQGQDIIKNSYKTEKATIKSANKTYNTKKSAAEKTYKKTMKYADDEYYVKGNISEKEYKELKKNAEKTRDKKINAAEKAKNKTVKHAKSQHKQVVDEATKQTKGHLKQVNKETGDTLTAWDQFAKKISKIWGGISDAASGLWDGIKNFFGGKKNGIKAPDLAGTLSNNNQTLTNLGKGKGGKSTPKGGSKRTSIANPKLNIQKGFAKGGPIHRTQMAMVAEQSKELAYDPLKGTYRLLGMNGPAITQVKAGEHILNAKDTAKVLSGGLGAGKSLPGFAKGTTRLKTMNRSGKKQDNLKVELGGSDKKAASKSKKTYDSMVKQILKTLSKLVSGNSKSWSKNDKDTKSKTKSINKNVKSNYTDATKNAKKKLVGFESDSRKSWKQTAKDTKHYSSSIHDDTLSDYKKLGSELHKENQTIHKQWNSDWTAITKDFNSIFGRLSGYAKSGMSGAITQLNRGISGIDSALSQFGGSKQVIKPIHYATGTGPVSAGHSAMVNDAQKGPRQEAIVKANGDVTIPHGNNRMVRLEKGDSVLNGDDFVAAQQAGAIAHYAKGKNSKDALRKIIENNQKSPNKAFSSEYTNNVKSQGSVLQQGLTNTAKNGSPLVGNPWSKTAWNVLSDAMSGSDAGGPVRHSPGSGWQVTSGFGGRGNVGGGFSSHDGVDYSGAKTVHAMNSGTVSHAGGAPANWGGARGIGQNIVIGGGGLNYIYQELNGKANSGAKLLVSNGDRVQAGQPIAVLGPSGTHVHVGATHHKMFSIGGSSTAGWLDPRDITSKQIKGNSSKKDSALTKFVKKQLAGQIKWVGKNLVEEDELGSIGDFSMGGSLGSRAKALAAALKKLYPAAKNGGIAGILGNWMQESRLDPNAINSKDHGSGLAQWTFVRETRMRNWLKKHHYKWNSAAGQLDWALHEPGMAGMFKSVLRMSDPVAAARKFFATWESGGAMDSTGGVRLGYAKSAYNAIKREHGGAVRKGETYLVDEKGFEQYSPDAKLWKAPANGTIHPHDQAEKSVRNRRGNGNIKITQNIEVNVEGNGDKTSITKAVREGASKANEKLFDSLEQLMGYSDEGGLII